MKMQYYVASSLDGFIATESDSLDWLFPLGNLQESSYPEFIAQVGAIAMGACTYEWILRNKETVAAEAGSPWPYSQPVWVFTNRVLPVISGTDVRFVQGNVKVVERQMRDLAKGKNLWVVGGGDLAGQFYDAGLLDEIIVQIGSVTLGQGKPMFPRRVLHPTLRLKSVHQMSQGMVELHYEIIKAVKTDSN